MTDSKYLKAFQSLNILLTGSHLLVERPAKAELTTKSGIIIADVSDDWVKTMGSGAPSFVHVLAVGAGHIDDNGKEMPLDTKPGNILLVGEHSVQWFTSFPGIPLKGGKNESQIGIVKENATQARFESYEAFKAFQDSLSAATREQT